MVLDCSEKAEVCFDFTSADRKISAVTAIPRIVIRAFSAMLVLSAISPVSILYTCNGFPDATFVMSITEQRD